MGLCVWVITISSLALRVKRRIDPTQSLIVITSVVELFFTKYKVYSVVSIYQVSKNIAK